MSQTTTGISVKASFFILSFILFFFPPTIVVDGNAQKAKWGEQFIPTGPGEHSVSVFFKYLFIKEAGKASASVSVPEGQTARITYRAPWIVFMPGKIKTV
ncbi:MAG: hypothetical protein QOF16_1629 [Actinomycetota bacterium]|jgi:hypothetical protein|nr:hypothetical protein [Actinomycetota bacterium]MEA2487975.1 hypothetical protein [Actinomycetota bacterium]